MSGNTLDIATEGLLQTAEQQAAAQVVVQQTHICSVQQQSSNNVVVARSDNAACTTRQINSAVEVVVNSPIVQLPADCLPPRVAEVTTPGPQGPKGAPGSTIPPVYFAYGDAPSVRWTATDAGLLTGVRVIIRVAFNGVGPTIEVGVNADVDAALPAMYNDPTAVQEFENTPDIQMAAGDTVTLTISPGIGATLGSGVLLLEFQPD